MFLNVYKRGQEHRKHGQHCLENQSCTVWARAVVKRWAFAASSWISTWNAMLPEDVTAPQLQQSRLRRMSRIEEHLFLKRRLPSTSAKKV